MARRSAGKDPTERADRLAGLKTDDPEMAGELAILLAARDRQEFGQFLQRCAPLPVEEMEAATLIGRSVGPYVIDAEVGRGGMGSVWRAHRSDGRYEGVVAMTPRESTRHAHSRSTRAHVDRNLSPRASAMR